MIWQIRSIIKKAVLHSIHLKNEHRRQKLFPNGDSLQPDCWDMSINTDDHLAIQDCDTVKLAEEYGTPLYVVDKARLKKNYDQFYQSFNSLYPNIIIGYSYKTNPLPGVLKALHEFGAYAEVISQFELWLALKLGVAPDNIIFNGPSKTRDSLQLAIDHKIKIINIDNFSEISTIDELASTRNHKQNVGVRLVTSVGWSSQFGLSIKNGAAFEAFRQIKAKKNLVACGVHLHLGTGLKDISTYLQAIKEVLEFARSLKSELDITIQYYDFGGGFGVPTVRPFTPIDSSLMANDYPIAPMDLTSSPPLSDYSRSIIDLFTQYIDVAAEPLPCLIFEPGRAITSSAQSMLLSILAIKQSENNTKNVIVDGGKNITMPLAYEYHEIFPASAMSKEKDSLYNIYGPLCHPSDIIFLLKKLPTLKVDDIIAIMDAGAYFVPNQMNFSNPRPAVIMVHEGKHELLRERESFENIVALDKL